MWPLQPVAVGPSRQVRHHWQAFHRCDADPWSEVLDELGDPVSSTSAITASS
jgi:hypothetical protein